MRSIAPVVTLMAMTALAACGQVEPVILTVSMPDCTFRGATEMEPGVASLSLSLNGLGTGRVLVVEIEAGHTYDELAAHFEQGGGLDGTADWARPVIDVELSDTDGIGATAESNELGMGDYAVVCVDLTTGTAMTASPLQVAEAVDESDAVRGSDRGQRP